MMDRMIRAALLGVTLGLGLAAPAAQAAYTITVEQIGADVVATGAGMLNTTALGVGGCCGILPPFIGSFFEGRGGVAVGGVLAGASVSDFTNFVTQGPFSFVNVGFLSIAPAGAASGDIVGLFATIISNNETRLFLPEGYVSGTPLSGSATWFGATIDSLNLVPGQYDWTWGSGVTADSFTLIIKAPAAVPEPASLALFGGALLGLGALRRRRRA